MPRLDSRSPRPAADAQRDGRRSRADGGRTRDRLLEAAGTLIAEAGYAAATSKAICLRAGTNVAAVNYHFGSRAALYEAVLVEAHRQFIGQDDLDRIAGEAGHARVKLARVLETIVERATVPSPSWGMRVIARELLDPSAHAPALVRRAVLPKARVMRGLIGEILGLPPDHATVERALALVVLPCAMLFVVPRVLRARIVPTVDRDPDALAQDLVRYTLRGLAALRPDAGRSTSRREGR